MPESTRARVQPQAPPSLSASRPTCDSNSSAAGESAAAGDDDACFGEVGSRCGSRFGRPRNRVRFAVWIHRSAAAGFRTACLEDRAAHTPTSGSVMICGLPRSVTVATTAPAYMGRRSSRRPSRNSCPMTSLAIAPPSSPAARPTISRANVVEAAVSDVDVAHAHDIRNDVGIAIGNRLRPRVRGRPTRTGATRDADWRDALDACDPKARARRCRLLEQPLERMRRPSSCRRGLRCRRVRELLAHAWMAHIDR